jgi:phage baseplate assembly protein W
MPAITLADITSADWSLALDTIGAPGSGLGGVVQGATDVNQCIEIILTTPKGSDPLRPTFACDLWQFIDNPINSAIPAIVREVTSALTIWEPRITLIQVTAALATDDSTQAGAHLNVTVNWRLKLSKVGRSISPFASVHTTTVRIPVPGSA